MSSFGAQQRKDLKLQFAKADRNRDGRLTLQEFGQAFLGGQRILPLLKTQSKDVANANFRQAAGPNGLDISGFLRIMDQMNTTARLYAGAGTGSSSVTEVKRASGASSSSTSMAPDLPRRNPAGTRKPGGGDRKSVASIGHNAGKKAKKAGNTIGKWFGVVDDQKMVTMKTAYNDRKRNTIKRKRNDDGGGVIGANDDLRPEVIAPAAKQTGKLIHDFDDALAHYRKYVVKEKQFQRKQMAPEWFADSGTDKDGRRRSISGAPKRRTKEDEINAQLMSLPEFPPYFINLISFVQFVLILAMCADSWAKNEFAKIALESTIQKCTTDIGDSLTCPNTLECGSSSSCPDTSATRIEAGNMWIGPESDYLISFGAKYTPCMRDDQKINARLAQQRAEECLGVSACESSDPNVGYGCCEPTTSRAGMTNKTVCDGFGGTWTGGVLCGSTKNVVTHPCCVGNDGTCMLTTESGCSFREGIYHPDNLLCSEVNCLKETCKLETGETISTDKENANQPKDPNQWFRFILPLFLHAGVIHFALCVMVQYTIGRQIEKTAGWLRTALIYFGSGIGGYFVSGVFAPLAIDVGSDPAVFGLLAVLIVELFQSWQIVPNHWAELFKLLLVIAVALLIGTFPFIDNFGHVGGFFFGVVAAIIFLPYVTFGKWDQRRKRILLFICVPLFIFMYIIIIITFYVVQDTEFCSWCSSLNCIEYTADVICD